MKVGQSKRWSLFETIASIVIGFMVAYIANLVVLPLFGYKVTLTDSFWIAMAFTGVSVIRGYCVRRLFNWIHLRG